MDYDVLILGGGIIGCSISYELSKYSLNIALIEKEYDVADEIAAVNSAIIYDGIESKDTLMSKLEVLGNSMFDEITDKFKVPFKRCGSFLLAKNEKEVKGLEELYANAVKRGIKDIEIVDASFVKEKEPNIKTDFIKALYSKNTAVVAPYDLAIAYGEVAFDNGVNFKLEEEVFDIQKTSKGYKIITNKNKFTCKTVINTTPGIDYKIDKQQVGKSEIKSSGSVKNSLYLGKKYKNSFSSVIFTLDDNNEILNSINNIKGNILITKKDEEAINFKDMESFVDDFIRGYDEKNIKEFFIRKFYDDPIIIDDSLIDKGYIKISGKYYSEITMTPSIAKMVCETIVGNLNAKPKKEYFDKRREMFRFRELSNDEKNQMIKVNKKYGKIICVCQTVTEGEIIDAIRRPLGARTVEGVRRRTGVTFGDCQGAYCLNSIVNILARETNKNVNEIVKSSKNSYIVKGRIKEFNEM